MLDILLTTGVAFVITFLAIPVVIQIADLKRLYDIPDERKIHTRLIPSLGGVGVFIGFFLACLLSINTAINPEFQYFFAAAFIIFWLGLKDDLVILSATKKLIGQIIAAAIIIHLADLRIESMHGLLGIDKLPLAFSFAISYLTVIVIINAYNLIDGIDGLAGTLGLISMLAFGVYFYAIEMVNYAILSFAVAGSLVAFLIFNHHPAKIFMGDSGSLMIGLMNSILAMKFLSVADKPTTLYPLGSIVALLVAVLIVPLLDTLRVFTIRIFHGKSPFSPDRNHVHHMLLDKNLNHSSITLILAAINIGFITFAWFTQSWGCNWVMMAMLGIAFAGLGYLFFTRKPKPRMVVAKRGTQTEVKQGNKVVAIIPDKFSSDN